ncbi:hypothetical protein GH714_019592 [Hevea brasiliensis]|uniref:Uncharacterized protein n=1 Tax=Hevea brasiliensis TaxID=3981 RepID=A0A6A6KPY5_HEVBR|nr:hypothetical protein GH714_019592 [Hevea brasiliensis]
MAVHSMEEEPFIQLRSIALRFSRDEVLSMQRTNGNTILHEAAAIGNIVLIKIIAHEYPQLIQMKNDLGESPEFTAAAFGCTEIVEFFTETALRLLTLYESLQWLEEDEPPWLLDRTGTTPLDALADMPFAFRSGHTMGIFESLIYFCLPDQEETRTKVSGIPGQSSIQEQDLETSGSPVPIQPESQIHKGMR